MSSGFGPSVSRSFRVEAKRYLRTDPTGVVVVIESAGIPPCAEIRGARRPVAVTKIGARLAGSRGGRWAAPQYGHGAAGRLHHFPEFGCARSHYGYVIGGHWFVKRQNTENSGCEEYRGSHKQVSLLRPGPRQEDRQINCPDRCSRRIDCGFPQDEIGFNRDEPSARWGDQTGGADARLVAWSPLPIARGG
jgi:hypothetical protein